MTLQGNWVNSKASAMFRYCIVGYFVFLTLFNRLVQWYTNKKFFFDLDVSIDFSNQWKTCFLFVYLFRSQFFFSFLSVIWLMKNGLFFSFLRLRVLYFYKIIIKYIIRSISSFLYINTSSFQVYKDDLFEFSSFCFVCI